MAPPWNGGLGVRDPQGRRGAGAKPRYTPRFARRAVGLPLGKQPPFARREQMRTPQCKAGRAARSVGKATRRTPPKPPARLGWPRSGQRGPGVRYARHLCRARGARHGCRRPRETTGPPSYGGRLRPSTYGATGTGRRALQGWRKPPAKPAEGLAKAAGLCNGWRAPSRRPWRRSGKRAAPGADPRATFVE